MKVDDIIETYSFQFFDHLLTDLVHGMDLIDIRIVFEQIGISGEGNVVDLTLAFHLLFQTTDNRSGEHDVANRAKTND